MITLTTLRPVNGTITRVTAVYDEGEWKCETDPKWEDVLNKLVLSPGEYYPDIGMATVLYAQRLYRGEIEDKRPKGEDPPEGRVY